MRDRFARVALPLFVLGCALLKPQASAFAQTTAALEPAISASASPTQTPEAAGATSLSPAPDESAVPVAASPSPSATPTATPSPAPLSLAKMRLQLSARATSATQISGGLAPYAVRLSAPLADAEIDAGTGTLSLRARANGSATVTVSDAAGTSVTASLLVAPSAGFVPADVQISLIGSPSHDEFVAQIRAALVRASRPLAGVRLSTQDSASTAGLRPGDRLDTPVRVHLDGVGRYVDVDGVANVHVVVDAAAPVAPRTLLYSDDPEKIRDDGVLFRGTMSAEQPVRLYYYHQAATAGHEIAILLDSPTGSARVNIVGLGAGPNAAFMFVGQSATFRFLDALARGAGVTLDVPVGAPIEVFAGDRPMAAGDLVAGVLDLSVVSGDPVRVTVVSLSEGADLRAFLGAGELPSDDRNRRGEYDLLASPLSLTYRIGGPEPAPVTVGGVASALQNRRAGGQVLKGDYGLLRPLDFELSNPLDAPATVYLYEQPIGLPVTTTIAFDGDPAPLRLQCAKNAATRYLVRAFGVPAGGSERITGTYMTDGGSTYPLAFGLTATEPSALPVSMTAPDGCFPKPAPAGSPVPDAAPGASPLPSGSPVPSASPVPSVPSPSHPSRAVGRSW